MHSLYRYFAEDGALLYVGISHNPFHRETQHRHKKPMQCVRYIELEWFSSRAKALAAEGFAIKRERPAWNISGVSQARKCRTSAEVGTQTVPILRSGPPVILSRMTGRVFGFGADAKTNSTYIFTGCGRGGDRVVKTSRHGDVIVVGPSAHLEVEHVSRMLQKGVHLCRPEL